MYALRIETVIPESRRLDVLLPADAPIGAVEVIILAVATQPTSNGRALLNYLKTRSVKPVHRRTTTEIDLQIQAERNAWE